MAFFVILNLSRKGTPFWLFSKKINCVKSYILIMCGTKKVIGAYFKNSDFFTLQKGVRKMAVSFSFKGFGSPQNQKSRLRMTTYRFFCCCFI